MVALSQLVAPSCRSRFPVFPASGRFGKPVSPRFSRAPYKGAGNGKRVGKIWRRERADELPITCRGGW
jgi:hypothetical protein